MQDSLLHVRRHGHGDVEDNILHFSCTDALDEPLGALWRGCPKHLGAQVIAFVLKLPVDRLSSYTPPLKRGRHARSFRGIALPKPQTGIEGHGMEILCKQFSPLIAALRCRAPGILAQLLCDCSGLEWRCRHCTQCRQGHLRSCQTTIIRCLNIPKQNVP